MISPQTTYSENEKLIFRETYKLPPRLGAYLNKPPKKFQNYGMWDSPFRI